MPATTILEATQQGRTLISDGAWGTFLQKQGLKPGECPELWCLEKPDAVRQAAQAYIAAGANMIQSNTFGGSRVKLEHFNQGIEHKTPEINEAAARISREAAGDDHWVIASMGPTGVILVMGEMNEDDLYAVFREQAVALEKGGADAICVETMSAIDEATLAVRAARENTACEVICTFTFEQTKQGDFKSMMGAAPVEACQAALDAGAHIIGANCGNGMNGMIDITRTIRAAGITAPILIHANAGLPKTIDGETVFPATPEEMAAQVPALIEAGANIIGGCCGTTPEHISAMRAALP